MLKKVSPFREVHYIYFNKLNYLFQFKSFVKRDCNNLNIMLLTLLFVELNIDLFVRIDNSKLTQQTL